MSAVFTQLRNFGKKIDGDLKKLEENWSSPLSYISGYGDNVEEASPYVEAFLGTIKEIQDQLIENLDSRTTHITETNKVLSHVENIYEELKQQYEDVEKLLADNGYQSLIEYPQCSSTTESDMESSILTPEQMGNTTSSSVFLSPDENRVSDTFITLRNQPKSIATPVIKSVGIVSKSRR
ncbi:uncharacterized protein [Venturia canescens]|uniref:uncharacterized protein n=1 Tax=Venturia canescens TaxID=32260 RepID=UPI001C9D034C|nr:uncharacterized protein LOC122412328 [Venturia canescens]